MKMPKIIFFPICLFLTLFVSGAYADSKYVTNQTTGFFASVNGLPPFVVGGDLGYQFTPYVGLQVGAQGFWGPTLGIDTAVIYDIAVRGILPIGDRAELFGKLGFGAINGTSDIFIPILNETIQQTSQSVGPTYGVGFGYCFTPHWMLAAQATGIYSTGSQVIRSGFKVIPALSVAYYFA